MRDPRLMESDACRAALEAMRDAKRAKNVGQVELQARRVLELSPGQPDAMRTLAAIAKMAGESMVAVELLRELEQQDPTLMIACEICELLFKAGHEDEALEELDRAMERHGEVFDLVALKGQYLHAMRPKEEALVWVERTLEMDPLRASHFAMARMTTYTPDHPHLAMMDELLARDDLPIGTRVQVNFAAGSAWNQLKEYERAFKHYEDGNKLRREGLEFDVAEAEANIRQIVESYTEEAIEKLKGVGAMDHEPVLIVGLPRSGSSLVEHVLSSHPEVFGAGETGDLVIAVQASLLRAMPRGFELAQHPGEVPASVWEASGRTYASGLRRRAPAAAKIVDKQLFNDLLVGVVHLMLPNARIIHCRRDAMDHCWSCYTAHLAANRAFMSDMVELGRMYRLHHAMMDHWHRVLPSDRIMALDHERMVEDPQGCTRELIDFIGLPWDDACLDPSSNDRPVRTMSAQQVREPIRGGRGGRWKPYEAYLGPMIKALETPIEGLSR